MARCSAAGSEQLAVQPLEGLDGRLVNDVRLRDEVERKERDEWNEHSHCAFPGLLVECANAVLDRVNDRI